MIWKEVKSLAENLKANSILQTHTSWVLLTGEFAYKIKKPVNFGFLDYTTLKLRKYFCQKELELNRRLAPEIYLDVIAVRKKDTEIFLGNKNGEIIDYALKMKELPQEYLMTSLLKAGKVNSSHIKEIARVIANFHNQLKQTQETARYGRERIIKFNWEENFSQTERFIGKTLPHRRYNYIKETIYSFINKYPSIFERRIKDKRIKFCHGDLHSQNIFIIPTESKPNVFIFDCIEFNQRFSCSDTASEIAFFLMDLEFHKSYDLADYFLDQYLQLTKDYPLLSVLVFYKAYRAYVRGKVTSFKTEERTIPEDEKKRAQKIAWRYFQMSEKYTRSLFLSPKVIIFFGPPAAGKTFLSERWRKEKEGITLRSDIIRKDLFDLPVEKHFFTAYRKGIYSNRITEKTYSEIRKRAIRYYKNNQNVFLDATFSNPYLRKKLDWEFKKQKIPFLWVFCYAPRKTILRRLAKKRKYSDATKEIYQTFSQSDFRHLPKPFITLNTTLKVKENIRKIEKALLHI